MPIHDVVDLLRGVALPAGLFAEHVADGVLHGLGLAVWEMPQRVDRGGGYHNALRLQSPVAWSASLSAAARALPSVLDALDVDDLRRQLFASPELSLPTDGSFAVDYGIGSALTLQNLVFAPTGAVGIDPDTGQRVWGVEDYRDDLTRVLPLCAAVGVEVWGNIGLANNALFWTATAEFNAAFALRTRRYPYQPGVPHPANPRYLFVEGGHPAVDPRGYVALPPFPGLDRNAGQVVVKQRPHVPLDPTHPEVVQAALRHVEQMVRDYGDRVQFVMPGELASVLTLADAAECDAPVAEVDCARCEPLTGFSASSVAGFRNWLRDRYGDPATLSARWGVAITDFAEVDPEGPHRCGALPPVPAATEDWRAYHRYLSAELTLAHVTAAKRTRPRALQRALGFHDAGIEHSWLVSDGAAAGDFYASEKERLDADLLPANRLHRLAAAARLSGRPLALPMTAPPSAPHSVQRTPQRWFPLNRRYSKAGVELLLHDVLSVGLVDIGYRREAGYGFDANAESVDAIGKALEEWKARRPLDLRFMAPWQRVALHVEDLDLLRRLRFPSHSAEAGRHLVRLMHDQRIAYATLGDRRVLGRGFARAQLRRSLVIVPFAAGLLAGTPTLLADYRALLAEPGATGSVLVLTDELTFATGIVPLLPPDAVFTTVGGRVLAQWQPTVRLFVLVSGPLPAEPRGSTYYRDVAATVATLLAGNLAMFTREPAQPLRVRSGPAAVHVEAVSDGINLLAAVSRLEPSGAAEDVELEIDPSWQARTGLAHTIVGGSRFPLAPAETRFVAVRAVLATPVPRGEQIALAAEFTAVLQALHADGFAVGHGERALLRIDEMIAAAAADVRVVAALVQLSRFVYVRIARAGARLTLDVAATWTAVRPGRVAVAGAEVRLLHPLNGYEEQAGVALTDAAGRAVVDVLPASEQRWSFAAADFAAPGGDPAADPVAVQVVEPGTGAAVTALA